MKKIAFTVIALLGLGTASFAQNSYDGVRPTTNRSQDLPRNRVLADNGVDSPFLRRFGFGVKVGRNVSSMSDLDDSNSKPGFTAGVFADYRFNDWFALSADLLYSREGTTIKSDGYKQTMKSNYLNIPILANFYVLDKLAFKVGVQPGIFLSAKIKDNSSGNDETVSVSDLYKGMDFSFPIGVSYEFFNRLIVEARYTIGAAKVLDSGKFNEAYDIAPKSRNNYFTISAGYRF